MFKRKKTQEKRIRKLEASYEVLFERLGIFPPGHVKRGDDFETKAARAIKAVMNAFKIRIDGHQERLEALEPRKKL